MPRNADKLPDSQLDLVKKWIDSGAPNKSGAMIVKKSNDAGLGVVVAVEEKPKCPPPLPRAPASGCMCLASGYGRPASCCGRPACRLVSVVVGLFV